MFIAHDILNFIAVVVPQRYMANIDEIMTILPEFPKFGYMRHLHHVIKLLKGI